MISMIANLVMVFAASELRHAPATRDTKLISQGEGFLLYGFNEYGMRRLEYFASWGDVETALKERNFQLPAITMTEIQTTFDVRLAQNNSGYGYRILWLEAGDGLQRVIHTPDAESALIFFDLVKFSKIGPSGFGYSVALRNAGLGRR